MSKSLVAYFSPTGSTKAVASTLAEAIGADLFEIVPEVPYKPGDLNWMDKNARSTIEMNDPDARPAIAKQPDVSAYDKIYVGFPIWWYVAPRIINTFLEGCELSGKTVIPFGHLRRQRHGAHGRDPAKILSDKSRLSVRQTV